MACSTSEGVLGFDAFLFSERLHSRAQAIQVREFQLADRKPAYAM